MPASTGSTPLTTHPWARYALAALSALLACNGGGTVATPFASGAGDVGTLSVGSTSAGSTGSSTSGAPSVTSAADTTGAGAGTETGESDDETGLTPPVLDVGVPPWEPSDDIPTTCTEVAEAPATSVGCAFYGMDVPGGGIRPYGISIGNPSPEPALVQIEDRRGPNGALRQISTIQVEPGDSTLVEVNGVYEDGTGGILLGEDHAPQFEELQYEGDTLVFPSSAFRITSDVPVTAMQIAPVGAGHAANSEASMLLPANALDTSYLTIGWDAGAGFLGSSTAWVFVVATQDGTTVNTTYGDAMLDEFDVLHLAPGGDASGLFVGSDRPVAVFSGAPCVNVGGQFCDHIEEQVFPLSSWGTQYVGARHPVRVPELNPNLPEPVFWRIYGAVDGSTVHLDPPHPELGESVSVDFGGWVDLQSSENFVATSDSPFLLVQFMSGCRNVLPAGANCAVWGVASGDPYMAQMVPVEQWITRAPFLTDTEYPRDFVVISRQVGTEVNLECLGTLRDDRFHRVGNSRFEVGFVDLDVASGGGEGDCRDGAHYVTASHGVGLLVGGVDWAASYGYPGGMFLGPTWTPPAG